MKSPQPLTVSPKYLWGIFILVVMGLSLSCIDKIVIDVPKSPIDRIVIQGSLIKFDADTSLINVNIKKLFDFTPNGVNPVFTAEVILSDEEGNSVIVPRHGTIGDYRFVFLDQDREMVIEVDHCYQIQISLEDGRIYESDMECLMPVADNFEYLVDTIFKPVPNLIGGFDMDPFMSVSIKMDLSNPTNEVALRPFWNIENCTKFVSFPISGSRFNLFDGNTVSSRQTNGLHVYDVFLGKGDISCVRVLLSSLSENAYKYWSRVLGLVERGGNMFEAPAAELLGNFHNTTDHSESVYGYFYASEQITFDIE